MDWDIKIEFDKYNISKKELNIKIFKEKKFFHFNINLHFEEQSPNTEFWWILQVQVEGSMSLLIHYK